MNLLSKLFGSNDDVDFNQLISDGAIVVDVRTPGEFSGGHVKNSINIPVDKLSAKVDELKNKKKAIIVCCASGGRSSAAKKILQSSGVEQIFDAGGWHNLK